MQGTKLSAAAYRLRIASSFSPFFFIQIYPKKKRDIIRLQLHCRFADINNVNGDKRWLIIDIIRESIYRLG